MVKNPHILESFENEERKRDKTASKNKDWYKKADQMYKTAISVNPGLHKSNSEKHLEMLIEVRKKMKLIENVSRNR